MTAPPATSPAGGSPLERAGARIALVERDDGTIMAKDTFAFDDGDHCPIHVVETPEGRIRLTDLGHVLMHLSFDVDIDVLETGPLARARARIVEEQRLTDDDGQFSITTPPEDAAPALARLVEGLRRIQALAVPPDA